MDDILYKKKSRMREEVYQDFHEAARGFRRARILATVVCGMDVRNQFDVVQVLIRNIALEALDEKGADTAALESGVERLVELIREELAAP